MLLRMREPQRGQHQGQPKSIGVNAFIADFKLESINIPGSVEVIDNFAFRSCTSLKKLTLGEGIKRINRGAFEYCESLESVVIPDSVEQLGEDAFSYCSSLNEVYIGSGVTTLQLYCFSESASLRHLTIGKNISEIREYSFSAFNIGEDTIVFCYEGTAGEEYVKNKGLTLVGSVKQGDDVKLIYTRAGAEIHYGDINSDGVINTEDVGRLQQIAAGWNIKVYDFAAADVNGDGVINSEDISLLQQYISGWSVTLGKVNA